jgi:hypothetical protein
MKKLFFFLFASTLFCSCACVLSQIPPKYIYPGPDCTAPIPDYRSEANYTGGCTGFNITQSPAPGTLLTPTNKNATVIIKATGTNGKSSQIQFIVTYADTITPKIVPLSSLLTYQLNQGRDLYNAADKVFDKMRGEIDANDFWTTKLLIHVSWDSLGYRKALAWYGDSLSYNIWVQDTTKIATK